jgi:hypothetical protein
MYNTHLLVDPDGGYEGGDQVYRKLHLFDADVDGGYMESRATDAGARLVVIGGEERVEGTEGGDGRDEGGATTAGTGEGESGGGGGRRGGESGGGGGGEAAIGRKIDEGKSEQEGGKEGSGGGGGNAGSGEKTVSVGALQWGVKRLPCSVGLSTCYDLRFPEMYVSLRDAGAEVRTPISMGGDDGYQLVWEETTGRNGYRCRVLLYCVLCTM